MSGQRVNVIANRLPVRRTDDGWETSPGGLVSALAPILREREGAWIGWTGTAGDAPPPFTHEGIEQRPVPLSESEVDDYYLGFCNGTLWPLYHDAIRPPEFHRHWWRPYVEANRRFAEHAADTVHPGDIAWIHDYQLQLVPRMLRELQPATTIGFFLHIPFPPVEVFARMPWRRQVLEGLLGADVLAFQTRLGRHNFSRAARRYVGAVGGTRELTYGDRVVRLQDAPISIDTAFYSRLAASPGMADRVRSLRQQFGHRTVLLGVDRLDYTKGIDIRLRAFETLLETHPERAGDLVFVQVAVPSREGIDQYAEMRTGIEELVGRINGRHGRPGRPAVEYLYGSLPPDQLVAHYLVADIMCVTPLRDGMNLVAKEYVASRRGNTGVLVLSEFAGAAQELRQALQVNPYDLDGVSDTFRRALTIDADEIGRRMALLRRQVRRHDVFAWARSCLEALEP
jgi:trehalose 6-phosphate synthase